MAQRTETYQLPFERGGFNANPNLDLITPISMVEGSRNVNLHNGGREKRGGTVLSYTLPATPQIMCVQDFTLSTGTQFIVAATTEGKIYKNSTTTIKTGMSANNRFWMLSLRDTLYICDGETTPQTWNGAAAATSSITGVPTDWTGTNFPTMMFTHSNGAAFRNIALGAPLNLDTVYLSASNNGQDFSDANVIRVVIPTNDGFGIVVGAEFGERALLFGKRKAYILNDADPSTSSWGYIPVQWEGGVANRYLLVKTPNDLIAMMEDGEIYSVVTAQQFGDYRAASISRPSFMHKWINDNVNLALIGSFHAIYDPVVRAIKFFVIRNGQSRVDTALVYYVDRPPQEAWSLHDNQSANSGYRASCSTIVRVSAGDYKVYTGGYAGEVWKLEQLARSDNSSAFSSANRTPQLTFDQARLTKLFVGGRISLIPKGDYQINIKWWVDGIAQTDVAVSSVGTGGIYGTSLYGSSYFGGQEILDPTFELGQIGKRIQLQFENNSANEDYFFSACYLDFKWIGKMPT